MRIEIDNIIFSDDSREVLENPNSFIFVATKLNERFVDEVEKSGVKIITPLELKSYFKKMPKIIGITGTNGKTTTACCIYSILLSLGFKSALLGTRGFFINDKQILPKGLTTPTLLELYNDIKIALDYDCDYFVMEVSSHAIAQNRIEGLDFALKILTNITADHLDFHKNIEEYERVKNSFFSDESVKLINKDSTNARFNVINTWTYGIENSANLTPSAYSLKDSISGHIIWNDFKNKIREEGIFSSTLVGKYNLYNILASIAAVKILNPNIEIQSIAAALDDFGGVEGRMQVVWSNPLVIVDFAHTADSMKNIFEAFLGQKTKVLFGAGGDRDKTKRPKMGEIANIFTNKIYLTSDNPRSEKKEQIIDDILVGIKNKDKVVVEADRAKAIALALSELKNDEILLILGKGDETYQIIGEEKIPFSDKIEVENFYKS
ncbi:UDP-N-acetylmuramoyl-L-alanyl-D-glutamate--2,6-diaminopimelate ligase [Helicobacter sp. MIT 99-5507]|uniref:UDP-N-acetylmuramoyl-L-alanyl-D-glutamate--2, 6-diaminopimelate ligase n=1 Tax=Helicobacter sp. MIT 99-5507 TaxID=152489 RepID=UPI000E1EE822|nr:UDP-N-acetylmuramoyl-L-alanyl-D-glutamate--2,6-diaminopimelate ligase [Helicobacter sp. MIT 99-5507]RDU57364.1 UDP-N-acetylmuramoyl-L-alanyl-D-glutamate--2,6-diaminopimelate ligase [Helicobacter sp. MIT 99-5507]